jgi:hypothetical protein
MSLMAIAYPIQPGMVHKIMKFANDSTLMGHYQETLRGLGIRHEHWFLQATDQDGGLFISVWEADNPPDALQKFQSSTDPFVTILKQHHKIGTGLDVHQNVGPPTLLRLPLGPAVSVFSW